MQKQKIMKKLTAAVGMLMLSGSLTVGSSAHAVTPDSRVALSGFWTAANTFKEYFDWRAWAGWGTVGATNVVITLAQDQSEGVFTKALFTTLCGSTAAGFLANWKPAAGPTYASHGKAIVKAGAVVASASACGWASQFAFNKINSEIPRAQTAINNASPANYAEIKDDAARWNQALVNMESNYKNVALNFNYAKAKAQEFSYRNCARNYTSVCANIDTERRAFEAGAASQLNAFNQNGAELSRQIKELAYDVKS